MKKEKLFVKGTGKIQMFDYPSTTKEGIMYKVRVMEDGIIRCSCPYNSIREGLCVHIKKFYIDYVKKGKSQKKENRENQPNKENRYFSKPVGQIEGQQHLSDVSQTSIGF